MVPAAMSESELHFWDHVALHGVMLFGERKPSRDELLKAVRALVQDSKYCREIIAEQSRLAAEADEIIDRLCRERDAAWLETAGTLSAPAVLARWPRRADDGQAKLHKEE